MRSLIKRALITLGLGSVAAKASTTKIKKFKPCNAHKVLIGYDPAFGVDKAVHLYPDYSDPVNGFNELKLDVVDCPSYDNCKLIDFQIGGESHVTIHMDGRTEYSERWANSSLKRRNDAIRGLISKSS